MKISQETRLKRMFESMPLQRIPLTMILDMRIARYNARIHALRHKHGMNIENHIEMVDGVRHSSFVFKPKEQAVEYADNYEISLDKSAGMGV